jgi:hypothetical protein
MNFDFRLTGQAALSSQPASLGGLLFEHPDANQNHPVSAASIGGVIGAPCRRARE